MSKKPPQKFLLLYLAIAILGLTFAFTFLTSNMTSIFNFIGTSNTLLPYLWLAAPLTGLFIQPIVGQLSDDTYTRFGKRRPYLFIWGIIAIGAFCIMPFVDNFGAIILLIWLIGSSINGATEALRALTGDLTTDANRAQAFALQAGLGGLGAAIGSGLPFLIDKGYQLTGKKVALVAHILPGNFKLSFVVSGAVIGITLFLLLMKVKEKPQKHANLMTKKKKSQSLTQKMLAFFHEFYISAKKTPEKFKKLCIIQVITWAGIFIFWLYFPMVLSQNMFHIPIGIDINTNQHYEKIFQQATLDSSFYSSVYQYISVIFSFFLFFLSEKINLKWTYTLSLLGGALGLVCISLAHTPVFLILGIVLFGLMWGAVVVLPSILAIEILPKNRIGVYLGILNVSVTAPQIMFGLILGPLYTYLYQEHANYLLLTASLFIFYGAFLMYKETKHVTGKKAYAKLPTESLVAEYKN